MAAIVSIEHDDGSELAPVGIYADLDAAAEAIRALELPDNGSYIALNTDEDIVYVWTLGGWMPPDPI